MDINGDFRYQYTHRAPLNFLVIAAKWAFLIELSMANAYYCLVYPDRIVGICI
jgi:hypothetical protein